MREASVQYSFYNRPNLNSVPAGNRDLRHELFIRVGTACTWDRDLMRSSQTSQHTLRIRQLRCFPGPEKGQ
jgi:hypothetical protein